MTYYLSKDIVLNIINNNIFFEKNNILDKTFSGIQKSYYKNGVLKSEFFHVNGKIEGEYKTYYNSKLSIINPQNKIIHETCNYIDNKIDGEYITYFESGQIGSIYNYVDGKKNGKCIIYYKQIKDTDKIQICETCEYINDNIHGEYIEYNRNGRIVCRTFYKNGEIL